MSTINHSGRECKKGRLIYWTLYIEPMLSPVVFVRFKDLVFVGRKYGDHLWGFLYFFASNLTEVASKTLASYTIYGDYQDLALFSFIFTSQLVTFPVDWNES